MDVAPIAFAAMGAAMVEVLDLQVAVRRSGGKFWEKPTEPGLSVIAASVVMRILLAIALVAAISVSEPFQISPLIAFLIGAAAPVLLLEKLAKHLGSSPPELDSEGSSSRRSAKSDALRDLRAAVQEEIRNTQESSQLRNLERRLTDLTDRVERQIEVDAVENEGKRLLQQMYERGLKDAKISFLASIVGGAVGTLLIFWGVTKGILQDNQANKLYASVLTGLAGIACNVVSGLLIMQTNQARKHLASLVAMLREDQRDNWRATKSLAIAGLIQDVTVKDMLHADLAKHVMARDLTPVIDGSTATNQASECDPSPQPSDAKDAVGSNRETGKP